MKTILFSLAALGILAGGGWLSAVEPTKAPTTEQVLILKNEHTMKGDIERVGDRYRVRREVGETWVPAGGVLYVATSLPDAYRYLRKRANLDDADEHLRLADWCRLNGLRDQALAEVKAAVQLRPDHAPTRRLLEHLQQAARMTAVSKPTAPAPKPSATESLPPVEVTSASLGQFATRVQPILMNTCARCHATGKGGKFHLTQVFEDSLGDRATLERNLAAVLAQVNVDKPERSRLLDKAVSDHAHVGQAPLRDRKMAAYRTLEDWIKLTVETSPHLREMQTNATAALRPVTAEASEPRLSSSAPKAERRSAGDAESSEWGVTGRPSAAPAAPPSAPHDSRPVPVSNRAAAPPPPPPPAGPVDPYDPEVFNRQAHPEAGKSGPGK